MSYPRPVNPTASFTSRMLIVYLLFMIGSISLPATGQVMPEPTSPQVISQGTVATPVLDADPAKAKPIGVGQVAQGGSTFSIQIGLPQFSQPVDIYFGVQLPNSTDLYIWTAANTFKLPSEAATLWELAWKMANVDQVSDYPFGPTPLATSLLPDGTYNLYLAVFPTGGLLNYNLWQTSFTVSPGTTTTTPAYTAASWTHTGGPIGGMGYDIRMQPDNPDIMYVTDAYAGAFKSTDGGLHWSPANTGITTRLGTSGDAIPVFSLTIDPNDYNILWAGTQGASGIYRSADAGANWVNMNTGTNGITEIQLAVRGFTVEPGNSSTVYFAAEVPSAEWNGSDIWDPTVGVDITKGVIYKSTDGGKTWKRLWLGDNLARYVWISPQDHNRIYASTGIFDREAANSYNISTHTNSTSTPVIGGVGILRSKDGGTTWEILNEKNGFDANELYIGSLYMHPTNPNLLLAASGDEPFTFIKNSPTAYGGIYITENGGDTWTEALSDFNMSSVEICAGNPNIAYAGAKTGVFRSTDSGRTWTQVSGVNWGPSGIIAGFPIDMQCDPRDENRIFINNYGGGNFLSTDGGVTWSNASTGYSGAFVTSLAVAHDNASVVYASARTGLFRSSDAGSNWNGLAFGVGHEAEGKTISVDPFDSNRVLALLGDYGPNHVLSTDGGQSWKKISLGVVSGGTRFVFSPSERNLVFAATHTQDSSAGNGLLISKDGGETWSKTGLASGNVSSVTIYAQDASKLYASLTSGAVYKSMDSGQSWQLVNQNIFSLLGEPSATQTLNALEVDPTNPNKLYAGYANGILISQDGGSAWTMAASGLLAESYVNIIAADSKNQNIVYAATRNAGIFLSTDGGGTWQQLNTGLNNRETRSLALSSDGSVLYGGSWGNGVFRLGTPASQ